MKVRSLLTVTSLFFFTFVAEAVPQWLPFDVDSRNKRFTAKIQKVQVYEQLGMNTWTLNVYRGNNILWKQPFESNGYKDGRLTNNGKYFVFVEGDYEPGSTLVWIYSKQGVRKITGERFGVSDSKIKKYRSFRRWLSRRNSFRLKGNDALIINTIDGKSHTVDLRSGRIIEG